MFFFRNDPEVPEEEENIEILISRLEHSEYLEDKYDALRELEKYAKNHILETGSYGLSAIIYAIEDLEDITYNLKILCMIFESQHSDEFVDLLLKNEDLISILMRNRSKDLKNFVKLISVLTLNREFCKAFVKVMNVSHYAVGLIEEKNIEIIKRLINLDNNFDKEIVFEGIFEKLLLSDHRSCLELIQCLLKDNHFNQNYFIETEWSKILKSPHFVSVNSLIDNTNSNINYIKDEVHKYYKFDQALRNKDYEYVYNMIFGNKKYRKLLGEIFWSESFENVLNIGESEQIQKTSDLENPDQPNTILSNAENPSNRNDANVNQIIILCHYFMHKNILKFEPNGFVFLIYSEILHDPIEIPNLNITNLKYELIADLVISNTDNLSRLLLLFSFRNIEYDLTLSFLDLNLNNIMYFLVLANNECVLENSNILIEKIHDETSDPIFKKFCILLCCIHNIKLSYSKTYLKENCKSIRRLICNTEIHSSLYNIDETTNMIIDKLNEFIDSFNCTS